MTTLRIPDWLADMTVADVLGVALLLGVLYTLVRKLHPVSRRLVHLIDDLAGENARPGVPARPGLMERVAGNEAALAALLKRLEPIERAVMQLLPDHGTHLADRVERMEAMQRAVSLSAGHPVPDLPDAGSPPDG